MLDRLSDDGDQVRWARQDPLIAQHRLLPRALEEGSARNVVNGHVGARPPPVPLAIRCAIGGHVEDMPARLENS